MNLKHCRLGLSVGTWSAALVAVTLSVTACEPRVKIEPPDKPIVINLNIKIEQEVRVRVEKDLENIFSENQDIFATGASNKR